MEIQYEITRKDIWNFNKLQFIYRPVLRNILAIYLLLVILFIIKSFIDHGFAGIFSILFFSVVIILLYNFMKWVIMRTPASKPGILGEHQMHLSSDGLRESTKVNDTSYSWAGILRIRQNNEYILLYTDNMTAFVIPKRVFKNTRESEGFYQLALENWNSQLAKH